MALARRERETQEYLLAAIVVPGMGGLGSIDTALAMLGRASFAGRALRASKTELLAEQ